MATDIDQSHYNTGTATVAANGTAVTGQGTTWAGAVRKGDLFGTHKGDGIRILSVDSNTALTLAYAWPGGAQTAAAYEIQRTPFDVGYLQAIEDLIRLFGTGNLPSLAGLDGTGGDKGVMLTGVGSVSTFTLTAAARALLDDATAQAMLTTLGLSALGIAGNALSVTAGTSANDFPVGSTVSWTGTDGQAQSAGLPSLSGGDGTFRFWNVQTFGRSGRKTQIAFEVYRNAGSQPMERTQYDSAYGAWRPLNNLVVRVTEFSASGNWTPHQYMQMVHIEAVAAGGGGSCADNNSVGLTIGSGGGGLGFAEGISLSLGGVAPL